MTNMMIIIILLVALFIAMVSQYWYMASITDEKIKSFLPQEQLDSHPDVIRVK